MNHSRKIAIAGWLALLLCGRALGGCEGVACTDIADKLCQAACDCTHDGTCRMTENGGSVRVYDSYDDCYAQYEDRICGTGSPGMRVVDCDIALDEPRCSDDPEGSLILDDACQ